MNKAARELLARLARTRVLSDALTAVRTLESEHGFLWRPVGDREGNYGNINIGSDPGNAFVERVTNAIDAVIEREAVRRLAKARGTVPASPREAVEDWLGVPGGRVANLHVSSSKTKKPRVTRQALADNIVISIWDGTARKQPTLEVRDFGIGLTAGQMPQTILSLNETNKIDKPYLAGAYGQGGSTALAFSPTGTVIASRRQPNALERDGTDEIGITFVRFNELDPRQNKNGRYEYLVAPDRTVAAVSPSTLAFEPGTAVVHFHMDVPAYSARMTQLTGSLWWLLQNSLFDPVLPFWVEERRQTQLELGKEADRRTIAGNYTRLMDDKKERLEYHNSVDLNIEHAGGTTSARVNYWVVKPSSEGKVSAPIDVYVDPYRPITFTFNGQTHGTEERRFTADRLSLPYLAKYLIIQVELDHLTPQARRELLSTTRDRLRQLSFYTEMRESICAALSEDEHLIRLNDERKELLLSKHSESEQRKMRERFARLMERYKSGADTISKGKGGEPGGRKSATPSSREQLAALPTADEPTFIRIANTQKPMPIRLERHALLRLESDAPDGYLTSHVHARLIVACDPEGLVTLESRSDFLGGRARMTVKPTTKARAGDSGTLTVFLFRPDDTQLTAKIGFRIEMPEDAPTAGKDRRAQVQVPTPVPVHRAEWSTYSWDENSVAEVKEDKDTKIFVNMDNRHISRLLSTGTYQETGLARMRNNFLLYVAFYAWAKHTAEAKSDLPMEGEAYEKYVARELDRVAQTVAHSISSASRIEDEE